jgi:predicted ArsR family transcriptional regulator
MSYGTSAALLVLLEERPGQWLSTAALAGAMHITAQSAAAGLDTLEAAGLAKVQRLPTGQAALAQAIKPAASEAAPCA